MTLILADKLDIKYTRVAKECYNLVGMRQLQYIKDIVIDIEDERLIVRFICDDRMDKEELEEFYFTLKVLRAISAFARKVNLVPSVILDDEEWELFKEVDENRSRHI